VKKPEPAFAAIIVNYDPKVHTPTFVKGIVRKLCLNESDAKVVAKTTAAIQVFQMTLRDVRQEAGAKYGQAYGQELLVLNDEGKCDNTKFRNFYEAEQCARWNQKPDVIPLLNRALATGRFLTRPKGRSGENSRCAASSVSKIDAPQRRTQESIDA